MSPRRGRWLIDGRPLLGAACLLAALASTLMLLIEGAGPPSAARAPFPHFDKLLHFAAHGWICGLGFAGLVLGGRPRPPRGRTLLAAVVVLSADALFGVAVEFVQYTLGAEHGRHFDWKDIVANLGGSATAVVGGVLVVLWLLRAYTDTPAPEGGGGLG